MKNGNNFSRPNNFSSLLVLEMRLFWTLSNTVMNVFSKKMDGFEQVKRVFYRDF